MTVSHEAAKQILARKANGLTKVIDNLKAEREAIMASMLALVDAESVVNVPKPVAKAVKVRVARIGAPKKKYRHTFRKNELRAFIFKYLTDNPGSPTRYIASAAVVKFNITAGQLGLARKSTEKAIYDMKKAGIIAALPYKKDSVYLWALTKPKTGGINKSANGSASPMSVIIGP